MTSSSPPLEPDPGSGASWPQASRPGSFGPDWASSAGPPPSRGEGTPVVSVGERAAAYDANAPVQGTTVPKPANSGQGSFLRELPVLVLIAVVLALLIKTFLIQAFFIPSGSMEQTLHIHDRVLVNKVVYHLRDPHRGEIVVFDTKGTGFEGQGGDFAPCPPAGMVVDAVRSVQRFLGVGACGDTDFIKRVVGVPGDTVQCCDPQGRVQVNGHPLNEAYVYQDNHEPFCAAPPGSLRPAALGEQCGVGAKPVALPAGMYWVMGDHRGDSSDSRPNGFVPGTKIVGRAFVRVWPVNRIAILHVPSTFQHAQALGGQIAGTPLLAAPVLLLPLVIWRRRKRG